MVRIEKFKNIHKGDRCFIMGTGPSLNITNLNLICDEILFGVNIFYKTGIPCKYYGVSDGRVWKVHGDAITRLSSFLFLSGYAAMYYAANPDLNYTFHRKPYVLPELPTYEFGKVLFAKDIKDGTYNGQTIIYDVCLQVAYYMGFSKVYLVGVDADYSGWHHFDESPVENLSGGAAGNWTKVLKAHRLAKQIYEEDGREILNATIGGKLEIYKRVRLEDIV